jgi:predicted DsbA family dithiol-disulfide isomerase
MRWNHWEKRKVANQVKIHLDVWSDYVCPYCYLEVPALERLQEAFGPALEIQWRAFELRPEPVPTLEPAGAYLRTTWSRSVYPMAERRGMILRLPPVQPRSRKALEAAAYARREGRFGEMHRSLFRAFFEEGRDIGRMEVLLEIARSIRLETEPLRRALEEGTDTDEVLQDQRLAHDLGISGVPAMLFRRTGASWGEAVTVSGARPYENLHAAMEEMLNREKRS